MFLTVYSVDIVAKCSDKKISKANTKVRSSHVTPSQVKPKSMSNSSSKSNSEMSCTLKLGYVELNELTLRQKAG